MRISSRPFSLVLILCLLAAAGCRRAPQRTNEVVAVSQAAPLSPNDAAWNQAPEYLAKLLLQDLVEPRLMTPSTPELLVRAITDGSDIAFRLQWADPAQNDLPGSGRFLDACAVQFPKTNDPKPPAPQMGEPGRPVQITFWRADWQASVNGRGDTIRDLYPNASIDHYPFEASALEKGSTAQKEMAKRYAPAEAAGNRRVGPRAMPVEDMVAEGPGTLAPAPSSRSKGQGVRTRDGWAVAIVRPVPDGLTPGARTVVAFAVWDGGRQEVGARKMRTGWIPLLMRAGK